MPNLYILFDQIKERPGMYLGYPSITNLHMFFIGYDLARSELGYSKTEQEKEFDFFLEWIQEKFNIESSQSWAKIILFFSSDERTAFENFFKLLEEFIENRSIEIPKAP